MEARKGRGVKVIGGRRKHLSASHFERELQKLEGSVNYDSFPCASREMGGALGTQHPGCEVVVLLEGLDGDWVQGAGFLVEV